MKSHFRKFGNQMSRSGNYLCEFTRKVLYLSHIPSAWTCRAQDQCLWCWADSCSWAILSMIVSIRRLASPPGWSYHSLNTYWEQKMVDDFLCLRWISSNIFFCSVSVALRSIHAVWFMCGFRNRYFWFLFCRTCYKNDFDTFLT